MPADWQPYAGGAEPSYAGEKPNLPFACLHWGAFALPFPLWRRDFVWFHITTWTDDGQARSAHF